MTTEPSERAVTYSAEELMRRSLHCLYVAVDPDVARDVGNNVHAYCNELLELIAAVTIERDALRAEVSRLQDEIAVLRWHLGGEQGPQPIPPPLPEHGGPGRTAEVTIAPKEPTE